MLKLKLFVKIWYKSLFSYHESRARMTPRRLVFTLVFFPGFLVLETVNWVCLLLDDVFFRGYSKLDVKDPLFIVGFPRSGTTFLHRLLAKDEQFTCFKLWELLFAPAIVQKKFWLMIGALDRCVGSPLYRVTLFFEHRMFQKTSAMHHISLFEPEEDELIFIHTFSAAFLAVLFPFDEIAQPFIRFDAVMPQTEKEALMNFYTRCIQRHLYVFGADKRFLSKNPAFSAKVNSIGSAFQSAKVVCLVRSPFEAIPSAISWMSYNTNQFNEFVDPQLQVNRLLSAISYWYTYPIEQLKRWPSNQHVIERYDQLTAQPAERIEGLYRQFQFKMSQGFRNTLEQQSKRSRKYKSAHRYSLEEFGLSVESIAHDFKMIVEEFGFEKPDRKR